ncbi:MATE family efflux transporter [Treponema sp.]|uniref:MATE family efflux transporter n=1 Tax=Treponema sp. TaxID=166 RepID=UPI00298D9306|nr:MATE family efflux transporter [Treponema sp.]MCQ2240067.1 MATE family efflux transporter [Treponema sp.]
MSENVKNMTEGKTLPILIKFALPLVAGNVFQLMYTFFDTAIVGKYLGVQALAALGAVEYLIWLLYGFVQGITQGFSIKMAQDFGANDEKSLKKVIGNSAVLSVVTSIILLAAGILSSKPILKMLHTPDEILPLSTLYINILFIGLPVIFAYNLLAGLLRSLGNSKTPLHAVIVSSIINISLDLIFVLVFKWGIAGAAIATLIAQVVASIYCLINLRKIPQVRISKSDFKIDIVLSKKLYFLGIPLAVQGAIIAVGGMIVEFVVNSFGVAFMAAYVAVTKLYGLLDIAATSFGFALMTFVGQNHGAKLYGRIKTGTRSGMTLSLTCSIIISTIMIFFGRTILTVFVSEGDADGVLVMETAYRYLRLMSTFLPILYLLWLTRSVIQGLGNTFIPMVSGIMEFIMRTGSALVLPIFIGSNGILYAEVLAWVGADLVLIPVFVYMFKKMKN